MTILCFHNSLIITTLSLAYIPHRINRLVTLHNTYHLQRFGKYWFKQTISRAGSFEIQTSSKLFAMLTTINFAQRSVDMISTSESVASSGSLSFCKDKSLELMEIYFTVQTVAVTLTECELLIALFKAGFSPADPSQHCSTHVQMHWAQLHCSRFN